MATPAVFLWALFRELDGADATRFRRGAALAAAGASILSVAMNLRNIWLLLQMIPTVVEHGYETEAEFRAGIGLNVWTMLVPALFWLVLYLAFWKLRFPWESSFVRTFAGILCAVVIVLGLRETYYSVSRFVEFAVRGYPDTMSWLWRALDPWSLVVNLLSWMCMALFLFALARGQKRFG